MESQYYQQRMLEINVISGEDLRLNGRPIKKNTTVHVRMNAHAEASSTRADKYGGSYPLWDDKIDLKFPGNAKEIIVEVFSDKKFVGKAVIPTKEIVEDYVPPHCLHFLSYRLRDYQRRPNGIIHLSARVKEGFIE